MLGPRHAEVDRGRPQLGPGRLDRTGQPAPRRRRLPDQRGASASIATSTSRAPAPPSSSRQATPPPRLLVVLGLGQRARVGRPVGAEVLAGRRRCLATGSDCSVGLDDGRSASVYDGTVLGPARRGWARTSPSRRRRSTARARRAGRRLEYSKVSGPICVGLQEADRDPGRDAERAGHHRHRRPRTARSSRPARRRPRSGRRPARRCRCRARRCRGSTRTRRPRGTSPAARPPSRSGSGSHG